MRGISYRPGRRRTGSVLLAVGAAVMFGLGSGSAALAKAPVGRAHGLARAPLHTTVVSGARPSAAPSATAHAAGHKIA
jgi:hypothetical protein